MKTTESRMHVLLVEDNPAFAHLTTHLLRRSPAQVTVDHVGSGEAALAYLQQDHPYIGRPTPCLIVLDLGLPGIDGHEVLRRLKRHPAWRGIPVVVFTSSDREKDRRMATESGASAYLLKPCDYQGWAQVVEELWRRCSGAHPTEHRPETDPGG